MQISKCDLKKARSIKNEDGRLDAIQSTFDEIDSNGSASGFFYEIRKNTNS